MANEIKTRASLSVTKGGSAAYRDTGDLTFSMTGSRVLQTRQSVGTVAEALILGEVPAAQARFLIRNMDSSNKVSLLPASGGVATIEIGPGEAVMGKFASTVSAPFVQASVAAVEIDITLVQV